MNQKDYKAIARVIKTEYIRCDFDSHEQIVRRDVLTDIALRLADCFAKDSLCFDKTKFLIAFEFED